MTRCHCTDTPFEEVSRRVRAGQSLDQAQLESGVGLLCTACLPDLRAHLAGTGADEGACGSVGSDGADSEPTAA